MSIHTIISRSALVGIFVAAAGTAFARQPPALTAAQRAAEREVACEGERPTAGPGYRDALVRFNAVTQGSTSASAGYRDVVARFGAQSSHEFACTTPSGSAHASARR